MLTPTDCYRPLNEGLWTTASKTIVSCLALAAAIPAHAEKYHPPTAIYAPAFPANINAPSNLYVAAVKPPNELQQLAALENFAGKLLVGTKIPPADAVDLLNERFWDLI